LFEEALNGIRRLFDGLNFEEDLKQV